MARQNLTNLWTLLGSNQRPSRLNRDALIKVEKKGRVNLKPFSWTLLGSNQRPPDYESGALTV
jgi:hypothetical protein